MHIQASSMNFGMRPQVTPQQLASQANDVFSALDSNQQGYLTQEDFAGVLSQLQGSSDSDQSSSWFSQLDADQDGQLTATEFSQGVSEQLYNARGMMGPPPGMPPQGQPPMDDQGKTVDELSAMLEDEDESSPMATDLKALIEQFSAADTDQDGKVTHQEAMAFKKQSEQTANNNTESSDGQFKQVLRQLMQSYGSLTASQTERSSLAVTV